MLAVTQYTEKLEVARKKKLEEMIAAARSGKPQGTAPKAAVPDKVGIHLTDQRSKQCSNLLALIWKLQSFSQAHSDTQRKV